MRFADGVTSRASQRGLVVCGADGTPLLVEHARAVELPALLTEAQSADDLVAALGGTAADREMVDDLLAERVVDDADDRALTAAPPARRVTITRSGVEFTGVDAIATGLYWLVLPVLRSWPGRIALALIVVGGAVALVSGRPDGPQVSDHPWVDATLGLAIGLVFAALHELAHAVALVHYGRSPRRIGAGFYWGALCFYVDSSDGITLPRRARIVNALAGLAVDAVTTCLLLIASHAFASSVLIMSVCWRLAILQIVGIVENTLPILEVDGHVALADYLDEPDLSPRSREALARRLRGIRQDENPRWLAGYGAFSLIGGVALLATSTWVWWLAAGDLITALFGGSLVEFCSRSTSSPRWRSACCSPPLA